MQLSSFYRSALFCPRGDADKCRKACMGPVGDLEKKVRFTGAI